MHLLMNHATGAFARRDCRSEMDGRFTMDVDAAKKFDEFGEAVDYSREFGIDWHPVELVNLPPLQEHPALKPLRFKH